MGKYRKTDLRRSTKSRRRPGSSNDSNLPCLPSLRREQPEEAVRPGGLCAEEEEYLWRSKQRSR